MNKLLAIAALLCTCCVADIDRTSQTERELLERCSFEASCDRVYKTRLCPPSHSFAYWCDCEIVPAHCIESDRYRQLICCMPLI